MRTPFLHSGLDTVYAPLVTKMLLDGTEAQLKDGSLIVLKAAIAASFAFQCAELNLDLDKLRTSVNARISEAAKLFTKCKSHFSNEAGGFDEALSITSKFPDLGRTVWRRRELRRDDELARASDRSW